VYRVRKQFHFSAAHQLTQLPENHPCHRLHGHNYIAEFVLESQELDERAFVVDYRELDSIKAFIEERLDHRNLNDVLPYVTSAENIARYLYEHFKPQFPRLTMVRVSETPKTWAEYSAD